MTKCISISDSHSPLILAVASMALALFIGATGCSKSDSNDPAKSGGTNTTASSEKTSPASENTSALKISSSPVEVPPLTEETKASFLANTNFTFREQMAKINDSSLTDTQKAQLFLLLLPSFNRDGQREFAHAAVSHIKDSTYSLIFKPLLEAKSDKQILSVFMTDTLKRPNSVKLPALLQLARTEDHPMQSEAKELLVAFIGKEHGKKWEDCQVAVNAYVANSTN
ncbi:MAG: hypothetical protein JWN25_2661 [Verrucomicrobiales bacterium]|nr:hypothetical protein [Verrucomicrobiales bacterium]